MRSRCQNHGALPLVLHRERRSFLDCLSWLRSRTTDMNRLIISICSSYLLCLGATWDLVSASRPNSQAAQSTNSSSSSLGEVFLFTFFSYGAIWRTTKNNKKQNIKKRPSHRQFISEGEKPLKPILWRLPTSSQIQSQYKKSMDYKKKNQKLIIKKKKECLHQRPLKLFKLRRRLDLKTARSHHQLWSQKAGIYAKNMTNSLKLLKGAS